MKVRKFCACGVKLERECADEESARQVVARFRFEHLGAGHGPVNATQYEEVIRRIIQRNALRKGRSRETFDQRRLRAFRVITGGRK